MVQKKELESERDYLKELEPSILQHPAELFVRRVNTDNIFNPMQSASIKKAVLQEEPKFLI
jgi:hypothetical protein